MTFIVFSILVRLGLGYRAGYVLPGFFFGLLLLFIIISITASLVNQEEE